MLEEFLGFDDLAFWGFFVWFFTDVNVVAEPALLHISIRKEHFPHSMLYTSLPTPLINTSICPEHFSLPMPLIVLEIPFIVISTTPVEFPIALLLILDILPLKSRLRSYFTLSPLPLAMFQSIHKIPDVVRTVCPLVRPFAVRSPVLIPAGEHVAVREGFCPLPMLYAVFPLAFVLVPGGPDVNSEPLCLGFDPLPDIRAAVVAFPDALALLKTSDPLAIVGLSIFPVVNTHSVSFTVEELACICVLVFVSLEPVSGSKIVDPAAFVYSPVSVCHDSFSVSLFVLHLSEVKRSPYLVFFRVTFHLS